MLNCSISLRAPRRAIAADLAEIATAVDDSTTGQVVFVTLVDDPGSASDLVDAYVGELMVEAATAADVVDAGLIYLADIYEELTALAAEDGAVPTTVTAAIDETASAADAPNASTTSGAAITTTSVAGPLRVFDATFPASSLTVIDVGR